MGIIKGWVLLAIGAFTLGSVCWGEEVDFRKVNPVLQSIADVVILNDDMVDFAYPRFDPKVSSIEREIIKDDIQGSLENTPWLEGGRADFVATATYRTDRSPDHTGIIVTMGSTVRTDVLAAIRYCAYLALKKKAPNPKFDERIDAHLKRLAVATSLDKVYDLLISGQILANDILADELSKAIERLRCLESGQCGVPGLDLAQQLAWAKKRIADWNLALSGNQKIQFETKKIQDQITELRITHPNIYDFSQQAQDLIAGKGALTMTSESVSANAEAFFKQTSAELDKLKADLKTRMLGVQNGNLEDKDHIQRQFRSALIEFKRVIRGQNW